MTFLNTRKFFLLFTFIFDNEVTYDISLLDELTSFQSCLTLCKLLNVQLGDLVHAEQIEWSPAFLLLLLLSFNVANTFVFLYNVMLLWCTQKYHSKKNIQETPHPFSSFPHYPNILGWYHSSCESYWMMKSLKLDFQLSRFQADFFWWNIQPKLSETNRVRFKLASIVYKNRYFRYI